MKARRCCSRVVVTAVGFAAALLAAATLTAPAGQAQDPSLWCWDADDVHARVEGSTIFVYHDAAVYNCCPDPFQYELEIAGDLIQVRETEVLTEPCYCTCCFDLGVTIENVPGGAYRLLFTWNDYETGAWQTRELEIEVGEKAASAGPEIGDTYSSGCLETQALPERSGDEGSETSPTWGSVKALFD